MPSKASKVKRVKAMPKRGELKALKPGRVKEDATVVGGAGLTYGAIEWTYTKQKP